MKPSELLSSRKKWCQFANARNEVGLATTADSPYAESWCLSGALAKCYGNSTQENLMATLKLSDYLYSHFKMGITTYNDHQHTTFDKIQQLLKVVKL